MSIGVRQEAETSVREDALVVAARRLYYLGCFTVPFLVLRVVGDNVTGSDVCFGAAAVLTSLGPKRRLPTRQGLAFALLLILIGGTTASMRALDYGPSLAATARMLFIVGIWPWMTRQLLAEREQVGRAVRFWMAGAVVFGVVSLIQTKLPTFLVYGGEAQASGRVLGLAEHPTDAGGILCVALPVALSFALRRGQRHRLRWLVAVALMGMGMVLAASVSSFLAGAFGVLVLAFKMRARVRTLILTVVGGSVAVKVGTSQQARGLSLSPLERFQATTSGQYDTAAYRLQTDAYAWHRIMENPFIGAGLDSASGVTVMDLQTHNLALLAWFQGGMMFLFGLVVFVGLAAREALRRTANVDPLRAALAASFAAAMLFSMTSPLLAQRYLWLPAILLLCLPARQPSDASVALPSNAGPKVGP